MRNEDGKVFTQKADCSGCSACENICPVSAITMMPDSEGFLYPQIDNSLCIKCGLCEKTCVFSQRFPSEENFFQGKAFVAIHNDLVTRMNSRSGAVFVAASDWILSCNGVVYGCILDTSFYVRHIRGGNEIERNKMCGSKYVQSDLGEMFSYIKADLTSGIKVLFSGTGCQVDGLLSYLKNSNISTDNLYTMDLVCHGVPSPRIWADYILFMKQKYSDHLEGFDFRDKKRFGWEAHMETFQINGKSKSFSIFRNLYHTDLCIRPSCYICKYANLERVSDCTLADGWGINKVPAFHDNRGVSLMLVNTDKGKEILDHISEKCMVMEVDIKQFLQHNLQSPSKCKGDREQFWRIYDLYGFQQLVFFYGRDRITVKYRSIIKRIVRKLIRGKKFYQPIGL